MEKISNDLQQISTKKEALRKAFAALQSNPATTSYLNLKWPDLDSHFSSLQSSLETTFKQLQSKLPPKPQQQSLTPQTPKKPEPIARSELKSFCIKMDGTGLRNFIMDHRKEVPTSREDVAAALRFASDPAKLVLDSLQGFYPGQRNRKKNLPGRVLDSMRRLGAIRRTCVLLMEGLSDVGPEIKPEVKEEAKKLAMEWKGKVSTQSDDQLEALVYLQLLASYNLAHEFSVDESVDLLVSVARRRQTIELCKGLGFHNVVPDLIRKLKSKGKQADAVRFAFEFELVDMFPPIPLLEDYLKEGKKVAQEVRDKGKKLLQAAHEAISREIVYVKSVITLIDTYGLESQFPRASLEERIEELEKQKPAKKRPREDLNQKQQQREDKVPRPATSNAADNKYAPSSLNHLQQTSYLSDLAAPYGSTSSHYSLSGTSSHYSLSGTNPIAAHYLTAAAGPSGMGLDRLDIGANVNPSFSSLYSSEPYMASGPYERPLGYGGSSLLSSYRSSYYP